MKYWISVLAIWAISLSSPAAVSEEERIEQEIESIERALNAELVAGDAKLWKRITAEHFVSTDPSGLVRNASRAAQIERYPGYDYHAQSLSDLKVRVFGDTAIATYKTRDEADYKGADVSGDFRWTDGFIRRAGQWELVAQHGSQLALR